MRFATGRRLLILNFRVVFIIGSIYRAFNISVELNSRDWFETSWREARKHFRVDLPLGCRIFFFFFLIFFFFLLKARGFGVTCLWYYKDTIARLKQIKLATIYRVSVWTCYLHCQLFCAVLCCVQYSMNQYCTRLFSNFSKTSGEVTGSRVNRAG